MEQNLNLYHIFYEVAKCRNFSQAARMLYISQPAISKSIARLETHLNTSLFSRTSKGVTLTSEGELLMKQVESALGSIRSAEESIRQFSCQTAVPLSIGVSTTLCKHVLLPHLKEFLNKHPYVKMNISCQSSLETIKAIRMGKIDVGLVGIPEEEQTLSFFPIKEIQDIFVTSDTGKEEGLFAQSAFILLDKGNISRKYADVYLARHHIVPHSVIEVNHMDLSIEFARAGLGIACVIKEFVRDDLQKGTLREITFRRKIPKRQIGFAYGIHTTLSETVHEFFRSFAFPSG